MECNRTHPAIISYGLYLYFSSRSLRLAAKCLESVIKRSHVSIWKWVQKYSDCVNRFMTDIHLVKEIFVDETLLRIDGQELKEILNSTILVCYQFFRQLRDRYGSRKAIYTDGARWYNDACKWLRLKNHVYDTGLKT
jgi:transposase-like protein